MLVVATPNDLMPHIGAEVGVSDWRPISAATIIAFAELTGENHWIHTDAERVRRETTYGGLVAHGFLTLSMLTSLAGECVRIERAARILNYGVDRLRFTDIVTADQRVRLRLKLAEAKANADGSSRLTWNAVVEIEGKTRPALVCDFIWLVLPEA